MVMTPRSADRHPDFSHSRLSCHRVLHLSRNSPMVRALDCQPGAAQEPGVGATPPCGSYLSLWELLLLVGATCPCGELLVLVGAASAAMGACQGLAQCRGSPLKRLPQGCPQGLPQEFSQELSQGPTRTVCCERCARGLVGDRSSEERIDA